MKVNRSKKKLQIREQIENLGHALDIQSLPELIQWFQNKLKEYTDRGYSDVTLNFESGGWDDPYDLVMRGTREETDKEYEKRMKAIAEEKRQEAVEMQNHLKFIEKEAKRLKLIP